LSYDEIREDLIIFGSWFFFKDANEITVGALLFRIPSTLAILAISPLLIPFVLGSWLYSIWLKVLNVKIWVKK